MQDQTRYLRPLEIPLRICALWGYDIVAVVGKTGSQPLSCYHDTQMDFIQSTLGCTLL